MINWNDIKQFDVTQIDLATFDPRNLDLPRLPEFEMPVEADRVVGLARDAAYASIGAVVVGVQHADERRRELTDQVTAHMRKLVDSVA